MNCTAFGLMVAIPLVLIHSMLQTKTTAIIDSLEMASVKFLNAITERAQEGKPATPSRLRLRRRVAAKRRRNERFALEGRAMQAIGRSARMARHHKRHQRRRDQSRVDDRHDDDPRVLPARARRFRAARDPRAEPADGAIAGRATEPPEFQLEITVRESGIEVGDRATGLLNRIDKTGDDYHLDQLTRVSRRRSSSSSREKTDATLLLEPDISYELLVAVMDRCA